MRSNWIVGALAIGICGVLSGCAGTHGSNAPPSETTVKAPKSYEALPAIPASLIGLDGQQLASLFGPAAFRRIDGSAELLRYSADDCVLHLILYRSADDTPLQVAHVEARDITLSPVAERPCIESLVRAHHAPPAS